jgi:hypothetical protein
MSNTVFGAGLGQQVALYIPGYTRDRLEIAPELRADVVSDAVRLLSRMFHGATVLEASGGWLNDDGAIVTEPVTIVYAFAGELLLADLAVLAGFVDFLRDLLSQEAVAIEINGAMYLF